METVTKKRSVTLSQEQWSLLKAHRANYSTSVACAASLGIDRNVLDRVLLTGSGSPDTITKILTGTSLPVVDMSSAVVIGK
jgi:hypothetical protein